MPERAPANRRSRQALRRRHRDRRPRARRRGGRSARGHRAERRRQDDADRAARRRDRARARPHPLCRRRHHRGCRVTPRRLGLARSFQITSLFRDFSVLDNVALAVQAHGGHASASGATPAEDGFARAGAGRARPRRPCRAGRCRGGDAWRMASSARSRSPWRWRPGRACSCSTSRWPGWGRRNPRAW